MVSLRPIAICLNSSIAKWLGTNQVRVGMKPVSVIFSHHHPHSPLIFCPGMKDGSRGHSSQQELGPAQACGLELSL